MSSWVIPLESAASDGTAASTRMTAVVPWSARRVRVMMWNATSRATSNVEFGFFDGVNTWPIATAIGAAAQSTTEYIVGSYPPGTTFPAGLRLFYIQPSAGPAVGNRVLYIVAFSDS